MNKQKKEAEKKEHKNKKDQKEKEKEEVEKKSKEPKKKKGKKKKGRNQVQCQKTFFSCFSTRGVKLFCLDLCRAGERRRGGGGRRKGRRRGAGSDEMKAGGEEMKIAIIAIHDWAQVMSALPFPIKTFIQFGTQQ